MRHRSPGFTLVEIVVAMAIVTGFVLVITQSFWGTQRQSMVTEARFTAAVLAQMAVERLKSEVLLNPTFLKTLDQGPGGRATLSGRVADPGGRLSALFEHLFARGTSDLYAPENRTSIAPTMAALAALGRPASAKELAEAYRDWQVDVTISDDEPPAAAGENAVLLKDLVKRVSVTVSRVSRASGGGQDPSAFTLHSRLLTPIENLTMPALDRLFENFERNRLEAAYEEFYEAVADNPYLQEGSIDPAARTLLADCYIVLGAINTEAYLSEGITIAGNTVLMTSRPSAALTSWVASMMASSLYQHSVFKKEVARIHGVRLTTLFDAFKKISPVLKDLLDKQDEIVPQVQSIRDAITACLAKIRDLDAQTLTLINAYKSSKSTLDSLATQAADPTLTTTAASAIEAQRATAQASLDATIASIRAKLSDYSATIQKQSDDLVAAMQLITVVKFLSDFFSKTTYRAIFNRLRDYPARFTSMLDDMDRVLRDFIDQPKGPTPYERVIASQKLVEATKLRQLDRAGPEPGAIGKINQLADEYASTVRPLSIYLRTNEAHDYGVLASRNARFLSSLQDMKKMARQYERIVKSYDAGGAIKEMLALYDEAQKEISLESGGVMAQLQGSVQTLTNQMRLIDTASPEALLAALDAFTPPAAPSPAGP